MPIRVTLDSNVWRLVSDPERHPKEPNIEKYNFIRKKIISREIIPFISETIFTLEGIQRKNRKVFFGSYEAEHSFSQIATSDNLSKMTFTIEPNLTIHPGNNDFLNHYLEKALEIGFLLLKDLRIAMIVSPSIKDAYFAPYPNNDIHAYVEKCGEIDRKMDAANCGIIHIQKIGERYQESNNNWIGGLDNSGEDEDIPITKAIAEWADGDSVAMHIAYQNDYFFTLDRAKSGGSESVFSNKNIEWLKRDYGFNLVNLDELIEIIDK